MTSEIDIYRAAQLIINKHGDQAESYAISRVRGYLDDGIIDGASAWQMIADAIVKLQEFEPSGEVH